jgi:polyisoprenoid-binding protein YceI
MNRIRPAVVACMLAFLAAPADAAPWTVDKTQSRIGFTATQMRAPFDGEFKKYAAKIDFEPANLAASRVEVEIATDSVDSKNVERDGYIVSHDWLASRTFPTARFETTGFSHLGGERYEARAKFTLRGETRDVVLPFTLRIADDPKDSARSLAKMEGRLAIKRNDYGVGQGQFRATDMIGDDVTIKVALTATRAK